MVNELLIRESTYQWSGPVNKHVVFFYHVGLNRRIYFVSRLEYSEYSSPRLEYSKYGTKHLVEKVYFTKQDGLASLERDAHRFEQYEYEDDQFRTFLAMTLFQHVLGS
jgi:hypothetical protein